MEDMTQLMKDEQMFASKYPRIYPIATVYGVSEKYLDEIFYKIRETSWELELDYDTKQVRIRMMIFRCQHFCMPFDLEWQKQFEDEDILRLYGKYNYDFAKELIGVF